MRILSERNTMINDVEMNPRRQNGNHLFVIKLKVHFMECVI